MKNLQMFCLIKKMIKYNMKRIQSKLLRIGIYMSLKFYDLVLMIKDIY